MGEKLCPHPTEGDLMAAHDDAFQVLGLLLPQQVEDGVLLIEDRLHQDLRHQLRRLRQLLLQCAVENGELDPASVVFLPVNRHVETQVAADQPHPVGQLLHAPVLRPHLP